MDRLREDYILNSLIIAALLYKPRIQWPVHSVHMLVNASSLFLHNGNHVTATEYVRHTDRVSRSHGFVTGSLKTRD